MLGNRREVDAAKLMKIAGSANWVVAYVCSPHVADADNNRRVALRCGNEDSKGD